MKMILLSIASAVFICIFTIKSEASVLNFDDLTPTNSYASIPENYGGLSWSIFVYFNGYYSYDDVMSGEYAAANYFGDVGSIKSLTGTFDFEGAYFMAGAGYPNFRMTVMGFNDGTFVQEESFNLSIQNYQWINFDFIGIDELTFVTPIINNDRGLFLMDDFTYRPSVVLPIPSSLLLSISGFLVIHWIRQRRSGHGEGH